MKVLSLAAIMLVSVACNNAAPTATAYKEQLGAPAAVTGTGTGTGTGNATGGDAAKGQTALATCTGCHADGGAAHKLVAADADSIGKGTAATNPVHGGVPQAAKDAFKNNALDMAAFLKGDAAGGTPAAGSGDAVAGEALLKAQCEGCHIPDGTGTGPALDQFATLAGQEANQIHASVAINFTDEKKKADIQAALSARK